MFAEAIGDGRLLYQKDGDLFLANLDLRSLTVTEERRVLSGVMRASPLSFQGRPWTVSGDLLVYGAVSGRRRRLVWVDRQGARVAVPEPLRIYDGVWLSPDRRRVATRVDDNGRSDLWVYDFGQDVLTPISRDGRSSGMIWGPTADRVTIVRNQEAGGADIITQPVDGAGSPEHLVSSGRFIWPADWTRNGRSLVLMDDGDISMFEPASPNSRRPLVKGPAFDLGGSLSPDERWLAYFSRVTGRNELFLTRFSEGEPSWRVSRTGAREAVWSSDGRELFYRSESGRQMLIWTLSKGQSCATDYVAADPRPQENPCPS